MRTIAHEMSYLRERVVRIRIEDCEVIINYYYYYFIIIVIRHTIDDLWIGVRQ